MALALSFGLLYTLPNFFGEAPAVQVSGAKVTVKVDQEIAQRVDRALACACLIPIPS
ncbi:MAG: protein translocase subunit SecD [Pseudomonadota bacterium]